MTDEIVDILFKSIAYGMYSDGTFALIFKPLVSPIGGETIEEAQKGELIKTSECISALEAIVESGFTIKAKTRRDHEPRLGQPIVLG